MVNKRLVTKVIAALVVGGTLFSTVTYASAKSVATATKSKSLQSVNINCHNAVGASLKAELDKLVTGGTITADEETKILDFEKQKAAEKKARMDKLKGMTAEEKKAYFAANPKEKNDLFTELVSANIITQAKADSIKAALPQKQVKHNEDRLQYGIKTQLDKLVTGGTITSDEETKILDFTKQKSAERKAEMGKVKGMTADEKKAYFASNSKEKNDLFTELVSANIITQAKADAIKATLPQKDHK